MAKAKKDRPTWPKMSIACPDDVTGELLRYWDWILTPGEGQWVHPEDQKNRKRYRRAIKTLLEYFE